MKPLSRLSGLAAPLWLDDVDTDQMIPGSECARPAEMGFGDALFTHWRYLEDGSENPDFVLNQEPYRHAEILVGGSDFGNGSSREQAVWALRDFGFRVIVAPSYGAIFRANCHRSGVLTVALPKDDVEAIVGEISSAPAELEVDLELQTVTSPSGREFGFDVTALDKQMLLRGVDGIGLALELIDEVEQFEENDRKRRPWIYSSLSPAD